MLMFLLLLQRNVFTNLIHHFPILGHLSALKRLLAHRASTRLEYCGLLRFRARRCSPPPGGFWAASLPLSGCLSESNSRDLSVSLRSMWSINWLIDVTDLSYKNDSYVLLVCRFEELIAIQVNGWNSGKIIKKRFWMSFALEKTPLVSLSFKLQ